MKTHTPVLTSLAAAVSLVLALTACEGVTASSAQTSAQQASLAPSARTSSYIVQAGSLAAARAAVQEVGGKITHELGIIDAVGARLSPAQLKTLRSRSHVGVFDDGVVTTTAIEMLGGGGGGGGSGSTQDTSYPTLVRADQLHGAGITGTGVTIAMIDSGVMPEKSILYGTGGQTRLLAGYDAINNVNVSKVANTDLDGYGHGTHLASVALSSRTDSGGGYNGVAPNAGLVYVKAFDDQGRGTYADVIRGIDWAVANKTKYKIRVMNMSFAADPQSWYWNDPLNQAVMKAWKAEIAVIAAAGNDGPAAMTIGVPGNVPYVVTVGAMTDNFSRYDATDDRLASFSSAGPTYEGFVKPELVAPGGHVLGLMGSSDYLPKAYWEFFDGSYYFQMSGTSQATAITSGIVALLLQAQPSLTVDQVKCKLMSGARPAVDGSGALAYTVFQQGAGLVDAYAAMNSTELGCANQGLDIANELRGRRHFAGPAKQYANGDYYVVDSNGTPIGGTGYVWNNGYLWNQGYLWSNGYLWNSGYLWNQGYLWSNGYLWNSGYIWSQSTVAPITTSVTTNTMVPQE